MYRLDNDDKEKLRNILIKLYGVQSAEQWQMNIPVYKVVVRIVLESRQCSNAMGWVPRPYTGGNSIKYATKQVVKAFLRYFSRDDNEHYLICVKFTAYQYRTAIELASRGL